MLVQVSCLRLGCGPHTASSSLFVRMWRGVSPCIKCVQISGKESEQFLLHRNLLGMLKSRIGGL